MSSSVSRADFALATQQNYNAQIQGFNRNNQVIVEQLRDPAISSEEKFAAVADGFETGARIIRQGARVVNNQGREIQSLKNKFNEVKKKASTLEAQARLSELRTKRNISIVKNAALITGSFASFVTGVGIPLGMFMLDKQSKFGDEFEDLNYEIDFCEKFPEAINDNELKEMYISARKEIVLRSWLASQASENWDNYHPISSIDGEISQDDANAVADAVAGLNLEITRTEGNLEFAKESVPRIEQAIRDIIKVRYYESA